MKPFLCGLPLIAALFFLQASPALAEWLSFYSVPVPAAFQGGKVERNLQSPAQALRGKLTLPAGEGPFPAVVLLHGCAGIWAWNDRWTRRLVDWGYVVLDVDSLTPRGRDNTCVQVFHVAPATRALDAFGAKAHLETLSFVDAERIAVFGMSHGAWAALIAAREDTAYETGESPFRAAVAFYPWCAGSAALATPLLILIGERDDWTPAERCSRQGFALGPQDSVALKIYPGAYHGFDFEGLDLEQDGHVLRYDAAAAADAIDRTRAFLARHLEASNDW